MTAQTQANLSSTFSSTKPYGSAGLSQISDLVDSIPLPNINHAPFRPEFPPYKCKFDGSTDDTAGWQAMFVDITNRGWGEVILPDGVSKVQANVLKIPNQTKIIGKGMSASTVQRINSSNTGLMFDMSAAANTSPNQNCTLQDFAIDGLGGVNGGLLRIVYGNAHFIDRCRFQGTNDFGLQVVQLWDSVISSCRFLSCGLNASASAYTPTDEGGGTGPFGSEVIQILGAIASTGFGSAQTSSNQVRFESTLIETFNAGAIVMAPGGNTGSYLYNTGLFGGSSSNITFDKFKIETIQFTGKYFMFAQSGDVSQTRFLNGYGSIDGASGANLGTMQGCYWTAAAGQLIANLVFNCQVANCIQSIIKCWGAMGARVDNVTFQETQSALNGMLWVAGGVKPDWSNLVPFGGNTPTIYAPTVGGYYAPCVAMQGVPANSSVPISAGATPGTVLSAAPNVINIVVSVSAGTFVQLPPGSAIPNQAYTVDLVNSTASTISIKPPTGGNVVGLNADVATTLTAHSKITYYSTAALTWV